MACRLGCVQPKRFLTHSDAATRNHTQRTAALLRQKGEAIPQRGSLRDDCILLVGWVGYGEEGGPASGPGLPPPPFRRRRRRRFFLGGPAPGPVL